MSESFSGPTRSRKAPKEPHKPYQRTKKPGPKPKNQPKSSAKPSAQQQDSHEHLTLYDWITVRDWYDAERVKNPSLTQGDVVKHFATRKEGAILFTQSSLSRHLSKKGREDIERRLNATPNALNTKRERIVVQPQVERSLFLWVRHMEEKGETVSGPMLETKRERFENLFDVPQNERLKSKGWIPKFCQTYDWFLRDSSMNAC
ncbi:hypothetical protein DL93DRAFT_2195656 [Clavulina sp. PMI_390]|nr:hypothetical protein DL93DRAFT_2195656 [Clavulina sp. PMI_390]